MKNILSVMASQIKSYRKKRGYTQVRLSSESGVELRHLQRIEAGSVDIRLGTVQRIAQTLKIPASQFFQDPVVQNSDIEDISQLGPYELLDGLNVAIQVIDTEGLIRYANRTYAQMIGLAPEEIQNRKYLWDFMTDQESLQELKSYIATLVAQRPQPTEHVNPIKTATGKHIWVHVRWNYIVNKDNKIIGFVSGICEIEEPKEDQPIKMTSSRMVQV